MMRWIGQRSYGLYLFHLPVFAALESVREPHDPINLGLVNLGRWAATFAIAELSYRRGRADTAMTTASGSSCGNRLSGAMPTTSP